VLFFCPPLSVLPAVLDAPEEFHLFTPSGIAVLFVDVVCPSEDRGGRSLF